MEQSTCFESKVHTFFRLLMKYPCILEWKRDVNFYQGSHRGNFV